MGWELGPENQQARKLWSSNGQVQGKHSWGRAKVFIMLGFQLQTELMDGAAPVPINSSGLPPLHPTLFSATTAQNASSEMGGGRRDEQGREWGRVGRGGRRR